MTSAGTKVFDDKNVRSLEDMPRVDPVRRIRPVKGTVKHRRLDVPYKGTIRIMIHDIAIDRDLKRVVTTCGMRIREKRSRYTSAPQ